MIQTQEMPVDNMTEFGTAILPPPPPESGESVYSRVTVIGDFSFFFDHWWIVIIDP